jgi:hypothetical protein
MLITDQKLKELEPADDELQLILTAHPDVRLIADWMWKWEDIHGRSKLSWLLVRAGADKKNVKQELTEGEKARRAGITQTDRRATWENSHLLSKDEVTAKARIALHQMLEQDKDNADVLANWFKQYKSAGYKNLVTMLCDKCNENKNAE